MTNSDPDTWGVETWRGMVAAWHCDEMGHQSARYYAAQAMEALHETFALLEFRTAGHDSDLPVVVEHHIRFHRELRAGTPVHVRSAVCGMTDREIRIAQILVMSITGEVAAGFVARCRRPVVGRSWPTAAGEHMPALAADLPEAWAPRGIGDERAIGPIDLATADRIGMGTGARGVIAPGECGIDGAYRTESFIARFSDATRLLMLQVQEAAGIDRPTGGAALEARCAYFTYPRAGDRFVIRTGIAKLSTKTRLVDYWMLDPGSGRPWCAMRSLETMLDLETRRAIPLADGAEQKLRPLMIGDIAGGRA